MIDKQSSILGVVLARGGSKGLPGKNIMDFCGKPLLLWSVDSGLRSQMIDDLVVSTDCSEISHLALRNGAEVPFVRPAILATDESSSIDALLHCIEWLEKKGRFYDVVVLLEPTSPLRDADDIDSALEFMLDHRADMLVSVGALDKGNVETSFNLDDNHFLSMSGVGSYKHLRRQDFQASYFLDGSIYCAKIAVLKKFQSFVSANTVAFLMPKWKTVEIDDFCDFVIAQALYRQFGDFVRE